jgi:hypothetical protein
MTRLPLQTLQTRCSDSSFETPSASGDRCRNAVAAVHVPCRKALAATDDDIPTVGVGYSSGSLSSRQHGQLHPPHFTNIHALLLA